MSRDLNRASAKAIIILIKNTTVITGIMDTMDIITIITNLGATQCQTGIILSTYLCLLSSFELPVLSAVEVEWFTQNMARQFHVECATNILDIVLDAITPELDGKMVKNAEDAQEDTISITAVVAVILIDRIITLSLLKFFIND